MYINIHWGNLEALSHKPTSSHVLEKNIEKLKRLLQKIDEHSIKLEVHLKFDPTRKRYKTTLNLVIPKHHYYTTEHGYSFEESIKKSIGELKRRIRKTKEKLITKNRKV